MVSTWMPMVPHGAAGRLTFECREEYIAVTAAADTGWNPSPDQPKLSQLLPEAGPAVGGRYLLTSVPLPEMLNAGAGIVSWPQWSWVRRYNRRCLPESGRRWSNRSRRG